MLFAFSWAGAQISATSIVPGTMSDGQFVALDASLYSQDGGTTVLTLSQPTDLAFEIAALDWEGKISSYVYKFQNKHNPTDALSNAGDSYSATDPSQWGNYVLTLPAGVFEITASKESQYYDINIVTITRIEIGDCYFYELDGVEVPMTLETDGTWTATLQEVIGTQKKNPDLSVTKLRLVKAKCNMSKESHPIVSREYLMPAEATTDIVIPATTLEKDGDNKTWSYATAPDHNVITFEAPRLAIKVTIDPSPEAQAFTFTCLEYKAFPRYIMPNAPEGTHLRDDFTRIPNDVTKEEYVRYNAGATIDFTVLLSDGQGQELSYAPAADAKLVPGARIILVQDGQGKVTVGRSAKYRLAYSLDADNNIVVSAADTEDVIEALEVWMSRNDNNMHRALPLKFDPETKHFVGAVFNDNCWRFTFRDAKSQFESYKRVPDIDGTNHTGNDPVRTFNFMRAADAPGHDGDSNTNGYYPEDKDGNREYEKKGIWYIFDAVEQPDGNLFVRWEPSFADTVPANAIHDPYYLIVTKEDGTEAEPIPMAYSGSYYVRHQTAPGEKYHFRGITTSILDGKPYVINQYTNTATLPIPQSGNGWDIYHCGGNIRYTMGYLGTSEKYIQSCPVNNNGERDENGKYHEYMFNWYFYTYNEHSGNRRAMTFDLDISTNPDPVLNVCTDHGQSHKLIYNHLRYKCETAIHLKAGEKVWVTELDSDGGETSHYWGAGESDIKFTPNPGTNIKLNDPDLFNPEIFKVYPLSADEPKSVFEAPEEDDYYVAVSVNLNDPSDKVIKFTRAGYPEYLYIIFKDSQPVESNFASEVVRIPMGDAGHYDTTNAVLLKYDPEAENQEEMTPGYVVTSNTDRLDAEGNLTLYNGERFIITNETDLSKVAYKFSDISVEKEKTGLAWGKIYPLYGDATANTVFRPGKNVRLYCSNMRFKERDAVLDESGTPIDKDQFVTTDGDDGEVYIDRHSYVFSIDLTSTTDPTYSWGERINYTGVDYALFGEYATKHGEDETGGGQKCIPFIYHPQTGLYTLSLEDFYGGFQINSVSNYEEGYSYTALSGHGDIIDTSLPFPLFNNNDLDGNPIGGDNLRGSNYIAITDPANAIGCVVSEIGDYGGRDMNVYANVTFVFDPQSHRLWVNTRVNEPDNKDIDPGKKEDFPMYMVFVRTRDDSDAIGDQYRSWREWAKENGSEDMKALFGNGVQTSEDFEKNLTTITEAENLTPEEADKRGIELAEQEFNALSDANKLLVADAKIDFFNKYFEIAGYRQMVPVVGNSMHFLSGVWDADETGTPGNGWIDTRCTNVADGTTETDFNSPIDHSERKTLSGLRYQMYLTDASECKGTGKDSDWELHNIIGYFFGEKEPAKGEELLTYMSRTVCYGNDPDDYNRTLRLGRSYLEPDDQGTHDVIRIDRRSVGGRRATLFADGQLANTEETSMSRNDFASAIDLRKPEGKIKMVNQISAFTFFVMKVMHNSRIFAELDVSTANKWSKVYRQDDRMYLVFNDLDRAKTEDTQTAYKVYENTQPRYLSLETVKKGEDLNRIVAPTENLPYNYVMKPMTDAELTDAANRPNQRDAKDKYAGDGFFRFSKNKDLNDDKSYFIISRKAFDDRGEEFDMHRVVTHSYNWLPLVHGSTTDDTRLIKWEDFQEKKDNNEIWWEPTPGAVLSAPLQINRTGYINFFSKEFLEKQESGYKPGNNPASVKAYAESESTTPTSDTGFLPTNDAAANVINDEINDLYVESATTDKTNTDGSFVYRAHVVLKGGRTPVVNIDPNAKGGAGYTISYTGPVAKNDMIYLERAQIEHIYTGVEDITVDTPAGPAEFTAVVSVDGRRLTVSGASQISVFTVSGMALATGVSEFSRTVEPGVYIIVADGATAKVLVR